MKKLLLIPIILTIALLVYFSSDSLTEEEKVERVIYQVRDGIEQEQLSEVMSGFSEQYSDEYGMTHDAIKGLFLRQFLRKDPITIRLSPMIVVVEDDTAQVDFEAAVFGGDATIFAIPNPSDVIHFTVDLKKQEEWKIVTHSRSYDASDYLEQ